jgi:hypothetical protein
VRDERRAEISCSPGYEYSHPVTMSQMEMGGAGWQPSVPLGTRQGFTHRSFGARRLQGRSLLLIPA